MGGWDPELREQCHEEFFFRAHRHGLRVGVQPAAAVWQWQDKPADDQPTHELQRLAVAKMGLAELTDLEGRPVRAPRVARAA